MGRLTLNVLLAFAQFEREVTGERIRDNVSASKKKGMWMGGHVPKGYDRVEGKLIVKAEEAVAVRSIFLAYLECGCVRKLAERLKNSGIRLPADELENRILTSIRAFLEDSPRLAAHFATLDIRDLRLLTSAAKHRSTQLSEIMHADVRDAISKITISQNGTKKINPETVAYLLSPKK
jgi:hypothetical protein